MLIDWETLGRAHLHDRLGGPAPDIAGETRVCIHRGGLMNVPETGDCAGDGDGDGDGNATRRAEGFDAVFSEAACLQPTPT